MHLKDWVIDTLDTRDTDASKNVELFFPGLLNFVLGGWQKFRILKNYFLVLTKLRKNNFWNFFWLRDFLLGGKILLKIFRLFFFLFGQNWNWTKINFWNNFFGRGIFFWRGGGQCFSKFLSQFLSCLDEIKIEKE